MPKRTLPMPTWHGSPNNLLPKYVKFLKEHQASHGKTRQKELQGKIDYAEADIRYYRNTLEEYTRDARERQAEIEKAKQNLSSYSEDKLREAYEALVALPEVIGTRVDEFGCLVVMLRPNLDGRDVGDYEYNFDAGKYYDGVTLSLRAIRVVGNSSDSWSRKLGVRSRAEGIQTLSRIVNYDQSYITTLQSLSLREHVSALLEDIKSVPLQDMGMLPLFDTTNPETIWEGYVSNPIKVLTRTVEKYINASLREEIKMLERILERTKHLKEKHITRIRELQTSLRPLKAELEQLKARKQRTSVIDVMAAAKELKFITTGIPGVMGIRFTDTGIPVIHIRSSVVYNGIRYDLGDSELFLELHRRTRLGVVPMQQTRAPSDPVYGGSLISPYWHTGENWFCFGYRSEELYELFMAGGFAQFVHLAVNTLNGFNPEHAYLLNEYPIIGNDEVWVNKPRSRARRARKAA